jgi:hypothetical protein
VLELGVRVREVVQGRGGRERDRGTRVLIALTLGAGIGLAAAAESMRRRSGCPARRPCSA